MSHACFDLLQFSCCLPCGSISGLRSWPLVVGYRVKVVRVTLTLRLWSSITWLLFHQGVSDLLLGIVQDRSFQRYPVRRDFVTHFHSPAPSAYLWPQTTSILALFQLGTLLVLGRFPLRRLFVNKSDMLYLVFTYSTLMCPCWHISLA